MSFALHSVLSTFVSESGISFWFSSRDTNALMAKNISEVRQRGYVRTYWHLGRKAASMMAPEAPSFFPVKSTLVMEVSMVTGGPSSVLRRVTTTMPEKVNFSNAPFVVL